MCHGFGAAAHGRELPSNTPASPHRANGDARPLASQEEISLELRSEVSIPFEMPTRRFTCFSSLSKNRRRPAVRLSIEPQIGFHHDFSQGAILPDENT